MIVSTHLESVITYFFKKAFGNFLSENIFLIYVGNLKKQSISISEKKSKISDDKISRTILLSTWDNLWDIVYKSNAVYDHFDIFSAW